MVCLSVSYWLHWFTIYAQPAFCSVRGGSSAHGWNIQLNTHPSSAEAKNEWSHTFIHTYDFMGAYEHLYIYHDLSYPCRCLDRTRELQMFGTPRMFRDSAQEGGKFVSPTHRPPWPPRRENSSSSFRGWVDPRTIVQTEVLSQNLKGFIGNRARDLPACSTVP